MSGLEARGPARALDRPAQCCGLSLSTMSHHVDTLMPHRLTLFLRQRTLAEEQDLAANRREQGLRLELAGIADRGLVEMGQPDLDRPLALGLGFLRRLVALARPALGVHLPDKHVTLRAGDAGGGGGLHAHLPEP